MTRATTTPTEIWKQVPGFPYYEASNLGRVKSMPRTVRCGNGWRTTKETILRQARHKDKYFIVHLSVDNKRTGFNVHTLVLLAHVGPANGRQCCHGDGDPTNNNLSNLRWDSAQANQHDRLAHGTYGLKVTEVDVLDIRRLYSTKEYTQAELGAMYGIKQPQVSLIVNHKSWALI